MIELAYQGVQGHRIHDENLKSINLEEGEQEFFWPTYLPSSGVSEIRVYVKELTPKDKLLDEFLVDLHYTAPERVSNELPQGTRYYRKNIKIFSVSELLLIIFAVFSTIGAIFEVLNFFFKK